MYNGGVYEVLDVYIYDCIDDWIFGIRVRTQNELVWGNILNV